MELQNGSPLTNRIDGKYVPRPPLFPTMSSEESARSPKARFQAFMAPSNVEYSTQRFASSASKVVGNSSQTPPFLDKRTISSPILQTPTEELPPPSPMHHISNQYQPADNRRTLTSHANSSKSFIAEQISSSMKYASTSSSDNEKNYNASKTVAGIIDKAGSAEAAVEQLLKEKQVAAARSEQLWQLVEKQRTMILGLNKDLELALQDKEKYWKRLKDQSASVKTTSESSQSQRWSSELQQLESQSPVGQSKLLPNGLTRLATTAESSNASPRQLGLPLTPESAESMDRLTQVSPRHKAENTSQRVSGQQISSPRLRRAVSDLSITTSTGPSPIKLMNNMSTITVEKARKAPPKPLNLSQTQKVDIAVAVKEAIIDSESEYSDIDDSDESSLGDRGRRPTREEDDRKRETTVPEEEKELRSRSGKLKSIKPEVETLDKKINFPVEIQTTSYRGVDLPAGLSNGVGLPSSPRAPLLGGLQSPMPPSMGSIGSLLKVGDRPIPHRVVTAPLMSPGLPATPRPGDRPVNAPQPRLPIKAVKSMAVLPSHHSASGLPFSPTSQQFLPSRHPPLPSPLVGVQAYNQPRMMPPPSAVLEEPTNDNAKDANTTSLEEIGVIYQGFTSENYPKLLLPPNALPMIDVKVQSCRLMPLQPCRNISKESEEDTPFTLGVYSRANGRQLRMVEKTLYVLSTLDQALKLASASSLKPPEKSLFNGQSPAKIDARRNALNSYFQDLLDTAMGEKTALMICRFLSMDILPPSGPESTRVPYYAVVCPSGSARQNKQGYLSKKGKSFGGWKARYFVIADKEIQYYDGIGGDLSGSISLIDAQIARQTSTSTEDAEYRHAFMILEPKRKDASTINRHILCAETDDERDEWIDALLPFTEISENDESVIVVAPTETRFLAPLKNTVEGKTAKMGSRPGPEKKRLPLLQTVSYDSTHPAESPHFGGNSARVSWSPTSTDNASDSSSLLGRPNQANIQAAQAMPVKNSPSMARKKRSIFGFRTKVVEDCVPTVPIMTKQSYDVTNLPIQQTSMVRGVFGIPLAEAAEYHSPNGIDVALPAPVYRCIEYLEQKHATKEEGIFRLSGSNSTVKALKERFNTEGDVRLLDGQHYDVHAVASVLKMYLRELPESVLTRKLHLDFLRIIGELVYPLKITGGAHTNIANRCA